MKVAFYIRVNGALYTSENQPNGAIFTDYKKQEDLCLEYAGMKGYEMVKIYRDLYKGHGIERPALNRMYRDANKFQKIIIAEASRISRDPMEYTIISNNFEELGVQIETVRGDHAEDRLLRNIMTSILETHIVIPKKG